MAQNHIKVNIYTLSSAKSTGSTQARHDGKIVYWDVKKQNKQTK